MRHPVWRPVAQLCVIPGTWQRTFSHSARRRLQNLQPDADHGPAQHYERLVEQGILRADDYQRSVVAKLQDMHNQLKTFEPPAIPEPLSGSGGLLGRVFGSDDSPVPPIPENVPKGMYLHGDVGCGKTMLMNIFYDTIPKSLANSKRRVHFHAFMEDVHHRSHQLGLKQKRGADSIVPIARLLARDARVLCFDEFQVLDIVDAMILKRLMESLIAYGVVCVLTSNRAPDDLYKNGIQRVSFIPCIQLIKDRFVVEDLDSGTDYRKLPQALSKVYYHPITPEHTREMDKLFQSLTAADEVETNRKLTVWGRPVVIPQSSPQVARFTFKELCGSPKSASDYMEITKTFATIFVTDMPQLTLNEKDQARRFILFIDSCYENKNKLFCLSDPPIEQIFSDSRHTDEVSDAMRSTMDDLGLEADQVGASTIFSGEEEIFAFARAVSRLHEMGTQAWARDSRKP